MRTRTAGTWLTWLLLASAPALAANHNVTVGGSYDSGGYDYPSLLFSPSHLTVAVGDTVTFTNAGGPHNIAADDGSFRCAQGCDGAGGNGSPSTQRWTATITFNQAGVVPFHCDNHYMQGMTGSITVEGGQPAAFELDQHGLGGSWANAATDSQGFVMEVYPDLLEPGNGLAFGGWFTWDVAPGGGTRWYTIQGPMETGDDDAVLPIYLTEGGAFASNQPTTTTAVGEATLAFADCTHGTLDYQFTDGSGRSGRIPLQRLLQNVTCSPGGDLGGGGDYLLSGAWGAAGTSGQGIVFDVNPPQGVVFAAWYTFGAGAAPGSGTAGQAWYTLQGGERSGNALDLVVYESSGGVFDQSATTATVAVGTAHMAFADCGHASLDYEFTAGSNAGQAGTLALARIGPVPAGCAL